MRRQRLRVELRLDGALKVFYQGRYLEIEECGARPIELNTNRNKPVVRKDHNAGGKSTWSRASSIAPVRRCGNAFTAEDRPIRKTRFSYVQSLSSEIPPKQWILGSSRALQALRKHSRVLSHEKVLRLYREVYFDLNMRHFHEKLQGRA